MRLFQNGGLTPNYRRQFARLASGVETFDGRLATFLADRYGACHLLKPVLNRDPLAFFTNADDAVLQRMWAREHGLLPQASVEEILLSQIEEHRTEVFYNLDPIRFPSAFLKRLPGSVRRSIAWRAAPSPQVDLSAYDAIVCNFPAILESYRRRKWRAEYFSPAHDPVLDEYAKNRERSIDVLFVGGYSQHHQRRAVILEAVARLGRDYNVRLCLSRSRLNILADSPIGWLPPLRRYRRPRIIRAMSQQPIFGLELYRAMSDAKIVLNGAVDMAGSERGNMRCFEAMGCGAALVSDDGDYPSEMEAHRTIRTYVNATDAIREISTLLADSNERLRMSERGHEAMRTNYSKERQWNQFRALVS